MPHTTPFPGSAGSLALLTIPYAFTQDHLLTTEEFRRAAAARGDDLRLGDLQKLHEQKLLLPMYRVSDESRQDWRIGVSAGAGAMNARGWVLEAAAEGRLRDPALEEYFPIESPYARPIDESSDRWWNGFVYCSWQLLNVHDAIHVNQFWQQTHLRPRPEDLGGARRLTLVLSALSSCYLSDVLGRISLPPGEDAEGLWRFRAMADIEELLRLAAFDAAELVPAADTLLRTARHRDPMAEWLPLLRHANYAGWSKLRGEPLDAMWRRVAAELLLRAHEELASVGTLPALPELTGATWHAAQHDRLTPRYSEAETLEGALAVFGLSPHPRVILILEGETELLHVPKLLAEFGLTQPEHVRVQRGKGSRVNAHLIARYNITPRVGRRIGSQWLLDATPTVLMIAMDAEAHWATEQSRDAQRRNLQSAIREEVRSQGADISRSDLDFLVRVNVWGDDKYELANFTDDELVTAILQLPAPPRQGKDAVNNSWESRLRKHLDDARRSHEDIKVVLGRMRIGVRKVALAEVLWPVLLGKCQRQWLSGRIETPALKLVIEIRDVVASLSSGAYALEVPTGEEERCGTAKAPAAE